MTRDPIPGSWYDEPSTSRRERRREDRRRAKRRRRAVPKLLLALVVVAALIGGGLWAAGKVLGPLGGGGGSSDYAGPGVGSVLVHIPEGASARAFGETLTRDGVVKSTDAFVDAAAADGRAESLQPGWYIMRRQMSAAGAMSLLFDPRAKAGSHVTVIEGVATPQLLPKLAQETKRPLAEFQRAEQNPTALGLPPEAGGKVEGFLFPSTYDFAPGENATQILRTMIGKYKEVAGDLSLAANAKAKGLTTRKAITVASIIEKEVANPDERAKVARVIYNRLRDTTDFPSLGMDSTTRYATGNFTGALTQSQLHYPSPYNTRVARGLPPGPIGNPGQAALQAALDPAPGTWLYFASLPKEGVTEFVTTKAQWNVLYAKYYAETHGR